MAVEGFGEPLTATAAGLQLAGVVLRGGSYQDVLRQATLTAKAALAGADDVSVTMMTDRPVTVAFSGDLATAADETQYRVHNGPCLDAIRQGRTVRVHDMRDETRWPEYRRRAMDIGVRSSVSVPLPAGDRHVGAFNVYSTRTGAFDDPAISAMEEIAGYAGTILNNAELYFSAADKVEQMAQAMSSRAVIEQAKGILMGGRRISADEAFSLLVAVSQNTHRKLHEVARAIVEGTVTGR